VRSVATQTSVQVDQQPAAMTDECRHWPHAVSDDRVSPVNLHHDGCRPSCVECSRPSPTSLSSTSTCRHGAALSLDHVDLWEDGSDSELPPLLTINQSRRHQVDLTTADDDQRLLDAERHGYSGQNIQPPPPAVDRRTGSGTQAVSVASSSSTSSSSSSPAAAAAAACLSRRVQFIPSVIESCGLPVTALPTSRPASAWPQTQPASTSSLDAD